MSHVYVVRCDSNPVLSQTSPGGNAATVRIADDQYGLPGKAGEPALPWRTVTVPEAWPRETVLELVALNADTVALTGPIDPWQPDIPTSATAVPPAQVGPDPVIYGRDDWYPALNVRMVSEGRFGRQEMTSFLWCPYRYNPVENRLILIRRALVRPTVASLESPSDGEIDTLSATDFPAQAACALPGNSDRGGPHRTPAIDPAPDWVWPSDPPLGVDYVVVTGAAYAPLLRPLVEWKMRKGLRAGLATVEAVTANYPAVDAAASIREYFKAAYAHGLQWALLAGDETVVPIRYAYAGFETYTGNLYDLQICDLYFAELDGDWDANGNGVYGEFLGDQAQLYPDIYIGRLPFSNADEATAMVAKTIAYERGPADGSYLSRALVVSADQMRDWNNGQGQQSIVAAAMPSGWVKDTTTMVEDPTGSDPSPSSPSGETLPIELSDGFGCVNYFVHGQSDGMIVRSAGLVGWPRSYVFTQGAAGDGNGHLDLAPPSGRPGIHLSVACDQEAMDMNKPPFTATVGKSMSQGLLSVPDGGAVAFIGQSRWGWVSVSYRLIQKFYEYLDNDSIPNHLGIYQSLAKLAFPSYRDLNFGNNLFGDPEMPVWKSSPVSLDVVAPMTFAPGPFEWGFRVTAGSNPVIGALVTLATRDSIWIMGETDGSGQLIVERSLPSVPDLVLTVFREGYRVFLDTIPVTIIADVKGGNATLPIAEFELAPNHPNPFNPSTVISFSIGADARVNLTVYDILGRSIRVLADDVVPAGRHEYEFDGTDAGGGTLASGVYVIRLTAGTRSRTREIVLLR